MCGIRINSSGRIELDLPFINTNASNRSVVTALRGVEHGSLSGDDSQVDITSSGDEVCDVPGPRCDDDAPPDEGELSEIDVVFTRFTAPIPTPTNSVKPAFFQTDWVFTVG